MRTGILSSHPELGAWITGDTLGDRVFGLPDPEAARLWGEWYRSGSLDDEELKICLDQIAFLDPLEAEECLRWLREEVTPEPDWHYTFPNRVTVSWPKFLGYLHERARSGQRIRNLAAQPREVRHACALQAFGLAVNSPERSHELRVTILAEALADPPQAAEWCLNSQFAFPRVCGEVLRRLWLRNPFAALDFMAGLRPGISQSKLPLLLRRVLREPSPESFSLALTLIGQLAGCGEITLYVAVVRVMRDLERWPKADQRALSEAIVRAVMRYPRERCVDTKRLMQFQLELAAHFDTLPFNEEEKRDLTQPLRSQEDGRAYG